MIDYLAALYEHTSRVQLNIINIIFELRNRALKHDQSKLDPEQADIMKASFNVDYGTPEYEAERLRIKPALDDHYAKERHHPEHFENGILGMTLVDLIEMLCDWEAATHRRPADTIVKSLEYNRTRFNMPDALYIILKNTIEEHFNATK